MTLRQVDGRALAEALAAEKLPVPSYLSRAVAIGILCDKERPDPEPDLLRLNDSQIIQHVSDLTTRWTTRGISAEPAFGDALVRVSDNAMEEAGNRLRNGGVDEILDALRVPFDKAAATLHKAAALGITPYTTAEHVLDMGNKEATETWRAIPEARRILTGIHATRKILSETLAISPTKPQTRVVNASTYFDAIRIDWSVCYAAADNFTTKAADFDWLAMAQAGLRLNTIEEIDAKYASIKREPAQLLDAEGEPVGTTR